MKKTVKVAVALLIVGVAMALAGFAMAGFDFGNLNAGGPLAARQYEAEGDVVELVVADRNAAEERIRRIAAPQNIARHPGFRTPCAKTGVCSDCNAQDRVCNTRMEMLRCWPDKRVLVVLIDEDLGL